MACWTVWKCDGCDREAKDGYRSDWKRINLTLYGFYGYPVGDDMNGERDFELCPDCLRSFAKRALPNNWPRPTPQEKDL